MIRARKSKFSEINQDKVKDSTELQSYEMDVIKFLRTMAVNHLINLNQMKKDLKKRENAENFKDFYDMWKVIWILCT